MNLFALFGVLIGALGAFPQVLEGEAVGHGVVSASSPWVASADAPHRKDESFYGSVPHEGLPCILGAGGREAAGGRCVGRDEHLVKPNGHYHQQRNGAR